MKKILCCLTIAILVLTISLIVSACNTNTSKTNEPSTDSFNNTDTSTNKETVTHEHQWIEATCIYPKTCRLCNQTSGTAKGHDFAEATCTKPSTCIICNETNGGAIEHSFNQWTVLIEPTCITNGVQNRNCLSCGHAETQVIDATGHDKVTDKSIPSTCIQTGLTEGSHCSKCNTILVSQIVTPQKNHNIEYGSCTECHIIINAYDALAYYVLNNGYYNDEGWYFLEKEMETDEADYSFCIFADATASELSFVSYTYASSGAYTYTEIFLNDETNLQKVYMEHTTSSGYTSSTYGDIHNNTFSSSNKYIYGYEYEGGTPTLSSNYKNLFELGIDLLLYSVNIYVLPDHITMPMLGFSNY